MIEIEQAHIPDVKIVRTKVFTDSRGYFVEDYNKRALAEAGIQEDFVQDNSSSSTQAGTIRGLHFQTEPFAQAKLVRVGRGRILDVVVDLRRGSSSYGHHVALELSAQNRLQLFVPVGFAHGFCTLEPDTEVHYKVTARYSWAHDRGIAWDDPSLDIDWPVESNRAVLSDKDKTHPRLADLPAYFS